jgi:hypothetical protein
MAVILLFFFHFGTFRLSTWHIIFLSVPNPVPFSGRDSKFPQYSSTDASCIDAATPPFAGVARTTLLAFSLEQSPLPRRRLDGIKGDVRFLFCEQGFG